MVPLMHCSRIRKSIDFYCDVLGFDQLDESMSVADPGFAVLQMDGNTLYLSSHAGDGCAGNVICVLVNDVDAIFAALVKRGLVTAKHDSPVHHSPVDQTWGAREFYVDDPDGNTIRFIQHSR